ncbi:MAG: hypothetical protein WD926_02000 [Patescibacteria group bacterium]
MSSRRTAEERLAELRPTALIDATAELKVQGERTQETLAALFNISADKVIVDYDPTPMVAQGIEGCMVISDIGELCPPDAEGWYEDGKASVIAIIRPSRAHSGNPYQDRDKLEGLYVRADCPPYRALKVLIENGIDL